jgi:hypothetical protein
MLTSKLRIDAGNGVDAQVCLAAPAAVQLLVPTCDACTLSVLHSLSLSPSPSLSHPSLCATSQGLGVPSFSHFLKLGEKKTPRLSASFQRQQNVQLSSGRMAKVTL